MSWWNKDEDEQDEDEDQETEFKSVEDRVLFLIDARYMGMGHFFQFTEAKI